MRQPPKSDEREGDIWEVLDHIFLKEYGVGINEMSMPRVMGLVRQLKIDQILMDKEKGGIK